jgi:hypothetical protein
MSRLILSVLIISLAACNQGEQQSPDVVNPIVSLPANTGPVTGLDSAINGIMTAYYSLHNALVEADTSAAAAAARHLVSVTDSIDTKRLVQDTLALRTIDEFRGDISAEAIGLAGETTLTEQRRAFSMITENLYPLLQATRFRGHKVYQVECPMAFNDNEAASWLSPSAEVVNPYLGKKHPKYAAGMVHCGEVKDSIAFTK